MPNPYTPPSFVERHRKLLAWIIGLVLGAVLPIPGWIVAGLFWQQGAHSNFSRFGVPAMIATVYLGSWVIWGFVIYGCLGLGVRKRVP